MSKPCKSSEMSKNSTWLIGTHSPSTLTCGTTSSSKYLLIDNKYEDKARTRQQKSSFEGKRSVESPCTNHRQKGSRTAYKSFYEFLRSFALLWAFFSFLFFLWPGVSKERSLLTSSISPSSSIFPFSLLRALSIGSFFNTLTVKLYFIRVYLSGLVGQENWPANDCR